MYYFSEPLWHTSYTGFESKASVLDLQPLLFFVHAVTIRLRAVLLFVTVATVTLCGESQWRAAVQSTAVGTPILQVVWRSIWIWELENKAT